MGHLPSHSYHFQIQLCIPGAHGLPRKRYISPHFSVSAKRATAPLRPDSIQFPTFSPILKPNPTKGKGISIHYALAMENKKQKNECGIIIGFIEQHFNKGGVGGEGNHIEGCQPVIQAELLCLRKQHNGQQDGGRICFSHGFSSTLGHLLDYVLHSWYGVGNESGACLVQVGLSSASEEQGWVGPPSWSTWHAMWEKVLYSSLWRAREDREQ